MKTVCKGIFHSLIHTWAAVIALSFFSLLSVHLVGSGQGIWGSVEENAFSPFGLKDIPLFVLLLFCWSAFFLISGKYTVRFGETILETSNDRKNRIYFMLLQRRYGFVLMMLIMLVCWLPYILSWFPGGVYADTWGVMQWAESSTWSNRHTFLYEGIWMLLISISSIFGRGLVFASSLMTGVQVLIVAAALSYSVSWLYRWGEVRGAVCIAVLACYCIVPAFPLFAISLWKDVFFTVALFLFSLIYISTFFAEGISAKRTIGLCLLMLFICFTRNNGIYVAIGSLFVLLFVKRTCFMKWRSFFIATSSCLVVILVIQGPLYSCVDANAPIEENLGVPLQQIGAVISRDGIMSKSQAEYFNSILPLSVWKGEYAPFIVDSLKWHSDFNVEVIAENPACFFKEYILLGIANPGIYFEAFFLNNAGFWDPLIGYSQNVACYQLGMWPNVPVAQFDVLHELAGVSVRSILKPRFYLTGGLFAWMMIACMALSHVSGKGMAAFAIAPLFLLWVTLMIASPLAISMRYFYAAVFMAPICVLLPFILAGRAECSLPK